MTITRDLVGSGLSFPVRVGTDGRLVVAHGEAHVRECLCVLLRTAPLERIERPRYGCPLDEQLFAPNDLATLRLVQEAVRSAISEWEPRVVLDDVRVATNPGDGRAVDITVVYRMVATGRPGRVDTTLRM